MNPHTPRRVTGEPAGIFPGLTPEEVLAASELRYRRLFETAKDGILILDAVTGMVVDVNPFLVDLLGFTRMSFLKKEVWELGCFRDIFANQTHFAELQQQEYIRYDDKPLVTADGRRIDVEFVSNVYLVNRQKVIQCNIRDISERRRSEKALRDAGSLAQATLDALSAHIAVLDDTGLVIAVNRAWRDFAEDNPPLSSNVNKGADYLAICDAAKGSDSGEAAATATGIRAIISGSLNSFQLEYPCHSPDTKRWFVCRASCLPVSGVRHVVVAHENITALKIAEQSLLESEATRRQTDKMEAIGQLAGGIAHDFNNVLCGIIGYTDMSLELAEHNSVLKENLLAVLKASERAKHLVKQILTFSRKGNAQKSATSAQPILEEVLELLRASTPSSIIMENDLHPDTKPVLADPTKLHEMLLNLANNAVQAMGGKGTLTVRLYARCLDRPACGRLGDIAPGHYTIIEVADNGCGMDDRTLSKSFDPFFTTKAVGEGTGMGLSVVLGVVQSHGGNIQIESLVGKGTTFRVFLPVTGESEEKVSDGQSSVLQGGTEKILFVDDEQMLVDMTKDLLTGLGYTVTALNDSRAALDFIREKGADLDLLITDQTMPGMTGIELAKAVRKVRNGLPIILCTGFSTEVNPKRVAAIGISQCMTKPFKAHEMAHFIRDVLDNKNKGVSHA